MMCHVMTRIRCPIYHLLIENDRSRFAAQVASRVLFGPKSERFVSVLLLGPVAGMSLCDCRKHRSVKGRAWSPSRYHSSIHDARRQDVDRVSQSLPSGQPPTAPRHRESQVKVGADRQTNRRLGLFTDGHYADFNLSSALDRGRLDDERHVRMTVWSAPGMDKPTFADGVAALRSDSARTYRKGDWLGPSWTNHWVHVVLNIPEAFRESDEPVICKPAFESGAE
jgi:hypothetical protein